MSEPSALLLRASSPPSRAALHGVRFGPADTGYTSYELADRLRTESSATVVTPEALSPWVAVEQLQQRIPDGHVVLYVRPLA